MPARRLYSGGYLDARRLGRTPFQGNAVFQRANRRRIEADVFPVTLGTSIFDRPGGGHGSFGLHFQMHVSNYLHD